MKTISLKLAFISIIALAVISCKKEKEPDHHDDHDQVGTPVITVTSFNDGDTLPSGAELHMNGTIASTTEMHGYSIVLHNHATMQDVFSVNVHNHATSYNFHEHWTNNVADTSTVMFTLDAIKDHDGGKVTKVMHIVCLP